jgi:hypothetical protein
MEITKAFVLVIAMFLLLLAGLALNAFVLVQLWGWFVVPTFGLVALSFLQAMGLVITVSFLTKQVATNYKGLEIDGAKSLRSIFTQPMLVLFVAWIVQSFI